MVIVDPLRDEELPPGTDGLVLGGGFPEVYAAELSANASLRADVLSKTLERRSGCVHLLNLSPGLFNRCLKV